MNFDGEKTFKPKERLNYLITLPLPLSISSLSAFPAPHLLFLGTVKIIFKKKQLYIIFSFLNANTVTQGGGGCLINQVRVSAFSNQDGH